MTYSRRNSVEDQQEAGQRAKQIAALCKDLHLTLAPVAWQQHGMQARVVVDSVEIAPLLDMGQRESNEIFRHIQTKLFEHAALKTVPAHSGLKAVMWAPVDVIQPQPFLSLWVVVLETDERIPIVEFIRDEQRVYEHYQFDKRDKQQLAMLFGPESKGVYQPGETVTLKERERQYTGEVLYTLPPGKTVPNRKYPARGHHTIAGTTYTNEIAARYIVDCNDGFPHIVHQSQIVRE